MIRPFIIILFALLLCAKTTAQNSVLQLNGTSDNVTLQALNLNSNTLTIEAWVKSNGTQNAWSGILTGSSTDGYGLMVRSSNELGYMWEDSHGNRYGWSSGLFLPVNQWCYVAMVVTPTNVTLYVNGNSSTHTIANDSKPLSGISYLGSDRTVSGRYFKGWIDEVRIWTLSRTPEQIKSFMSQRLQGTETGLKAYYKMDDRAVALTDYSPNAFHGTRVGTSYFLTNAIFNCNFSQSKSLCKLGDQVFFDDLTLSFNPVTAWKWTITGPEVINSTKKQSNFVFTKTGTYTIKLVVSDGIAADSITKTSSLIVANPADFDSLFFVQKRNLLTAKWTAPFNYKSVMTTTMPSGPYMGNGDVGVAAVTTAKTQTLRVSKVNFMADNAKYSWLEAAPSHIAIGGVSITANSTVGTGFSYDMDILGNELRMTTATTQPVKMKSWLATDENVMVTELSTTSATAVPMIVETFADSVTPGYATSAVVNGNVGQISRQSGIVNVKWTSRAGISTKIVGASDVISAVSNARVRSNFVLTNAAPVYVVSYVSGGGKTNDDKLPDALTRMNAIISDTIPQIQKRKTAWWKDMWQRSYVETNDDLLNRHYLSSIYQIASAHNLNSSACGGMYGVWNMIDSMAYNGDLHLNYNSQASFYSSFSSNRPETALPFLNLMYSAIPEGQLRAQRDMGQLNSSWAGKSCKGILFPVSISSLGDLFGSYWSQTMDAPFNVSIFSWYYEYTGDTKFLRTKAYPFIRQCGDFYESFIKKETIGNTYRYTLTCATHEGGWNLNPPADLGLMQQTFSLLLKYSKQLNIDADKRAIWADILNHCPKYATHLHNGVKVYAKDEAGWDYPAHMIQLHSIYPAEILTIHSHPDSVQIAKNTIDYFCIEKGAFGDQMNALGLSSYIMAARIGYNPDAIVNAMKGRILTAKPNFTIQDQNHGLEKTTPIEVINSMMLQCVDSILYIFPNWLNKPASFTRLRTKGAFIVSAEKGGNAVTSLSIYSEIGTACKIKNPWPGSFLAVIETFNGITTNVPVIVNNDVYSFATKAGASYSFAITTGIQPSIKSNNKFKVSPNPSKGKLTVQFTENKRNGNEKIQLFSLDGHMVLTTQIDPMSNNVTLNISHLQNGIYTLSCLNQTEKVIINK